MASLFDQNFRYTDRARAIFKDLQRNLHPIYMELLEEGFFSREISALVTSAAAQTENAAIAEWEEARGSSPNTEESQTTA
ncbi:hypothetical protein RHJ63_09060 [Thermosynechococcus sp. JY1334]|uniref:hypothetical protein n=1 Tax=unclassified Thermosynechococcus TaxID=2622553 RepID=UPI0026720C53|nr:MULTISPECIES: hypothetical protein [unclassified Thermosynechococcus]MDR7898456.1 hypothetical protein [Thermosynechococcus sp. JY1332]MDR7905858.1 hypothetical protein [Thermosynechococcus sp. JY1334]WKT85594.1 hypothetical protein QYC30_09085 [Thermosynechococcus sp. JY1339]WNC54538.1 hypothetical protein RHJ31_09070 [Thermosynechococcus sp. JY1331]